MMINSDFQKVNPCNAKRIIVKLFASENYSLKLIEFVVNFLNISYQYPLHILKLFNKNRNSSL